MSVNILDYITPVKMKGTQYDKVMEMFSHNNFYFRAESYCPDMHEIINRIIPDFKSNIVFLLWIEDTGYETEENKNARKFISLLLRKKLVLCE